MLFQSWKLREFNAVDLTGLTEDASVVITLYPQLAEVFKGNDLKSKEPFFPNVFDDDPTNVFEPII